MAILELPVRSDFKSYEFRISLDGSIYTLKFRFNARLDRWIMDIADSIGAEIVAGLVLLTNIDMIRQYVVSELPQGKFMCIDESGEEKNAGSDDLGNDVKLVYQEAS